MPVDILKYAIEDKALVDPVIASVVDEQFAKEREAAREARLQEWIMARLKEILAADALAKPTLLRQACEQYQNLDQEGTQ